MPTLQVPHKFNFSRAPAPLQNVSRGQSNREDSDPVQEYSPNSVNSLGLANLVYSEIAANVYKQKRMINNTGILISNLQHSRLFDMLQLPHHNQKTNHILQSMLYCHYTSLKVHY